MAYLHSVRGLALSCATTDRPRRCLGERLVVSNRKPFIQLILRRVPLRGRAGCTGATCKPPGADISIVMDDVAPPSDRHSPAIHAHGQVGRLPSDGGEYNEHGRGGWLYFHREVDVVAFT